MKKRALGRGLSALLSDSQEPTIEEELQPRPSSAKLDLADSIVQLQVSAIRSNPLQPRKTFSSASLENLAASIAEHGIVQPVVVTKEIEGYRLVVGERRWRAASLAGLETMPAIVKEMAGAKLLEVALIENLQREDLNPIEEAQAFSYLIREHKLTQEELARRIGCSRPAIANSLRLLALPPAVRVELESGVLSAGHARSILSLPTENKQIAAWKEFSSKDYSVRQAEEFVRKLLEAKEPESKEKSKLSPDWEQLQEQLSQQLNAKVKIVPGSKGQGKIELNYRDQAQLEQLVEMLIYSNQGGWS
jgi:ParB family transcriptional regulator, chromosome partitioning protein